MCKKITWSHGSRFQLLHDPSAMHFCSTLINIFCFNPNHDLLTSVRLKSVANLEVQ